MKNFIEWLLLVHPTWQTGYYEDFNGSHIITVLTDEFNYPTLKCFVGRTFSQLKTMIQKYDDIMAEERYCKENDC